MEFTALQIALFLGGEVVGNNEVKVNDVSKIEEGKPGTLAFLSNMKYEKYIYETEASVVLVNRDFVPEGNIKATLVKVDDAYKALSLLLDLYVQSIPQKIGVEQPSFVSASAEMGNEPYIGAFAYIGNNAKVGNNAKIHPHVWIGDGATIGDNTILFSGVKIYPGCKVGSNCIIHAGTVVGSDGFGFAPQADGTYTKLHQIGIVIIEDNVEIGANTTIDCATMGATIIRKGAKLDNLVHIAHNCEIGENTVIAAQVGMAGSTKIGKNCMFGGQVGIAGHISLGDFVNVGAQSGITNSVKDHSTLLGSPAIDIGSCRKSYVIFRKLPEMYNDLSKVSKEVDKLKNSI